MSRKHIISVGCQIPGNVAHNVSFVAGDSLLDADIVVFEPRVALATGTNHAGRGLYGEYDSASLRSATPHWKTELMTALESGKTIFLILAGFEPSYVFTGTKDISKSGRSVTNHVEPFQPYSSLPFSLSVASASGKRIKTTQQLGSLAAYWADFESVSSYEAYLAVKTGEPSLVTNIGDKPVGGVMRFTNWKGRVVYLPQVDWELAIEKRFEQLIKKSERKRKSNDALFNKAAVSVGQQFVNHLAEIDRTLLKNAELTPQPEWAKAVEFQMKAEETLGLKIAKLESQIRETQGALTEASRELEEVGTLRRLLYETGRPLEDAILRALRLVGFAAGNYTDSESEFDAVFVSPEGERLLGEAEGKNDKQINVEKADQLERNIREEFSKQDHSEYAKGVLFGNAYRLQKPGERPQEFFTDKCRASAVRTGIALVRTIDLFPVAKYLAENDDLAFALECRKALLGASGKTVVFPSVPITSSIA